MHDRLNRAYTERTIAAVLAAKMAILANFPAGVGTDSNEDSDPEWRVVLYVDFPGGQCSWHIAPHDQHLLAGLPAYDKPWDGKSESRDGNRIVDFSPEKV